jgi:hypothetical protein
VGGLVSGIRGRLVVARRFLLRASQVDGHFASYLGPKTQPDSAMRATIVGELAGRNAPRVAA